MELGMEHNQLVQVNRLLYIPKSCLKAHTLDDSLYRRRVSWVGYNWWELICCKTSVVCNAIVRLNCPIALDNVIIILLVVVLVVIVVGGIVVVMWLKFRGSQRISPAEEEQSDGLAQCGSRSCWTEVTCTQSQEQLPSCALPLPPTYSSVCLTALDESQQRS